MQPRSNSWRTYVRARENILRQVGTRNLIADGAGEMYRMENQLAPSCSAQHTAAVFKKRVSPANQNGGPIARTFMMTVVLSNGLARSHFPKARGVIRGCWGDVDNEWQDPQR